MELTGIQYLLYITREINLQCTDQDIRGHIEHRQNSNTLSIAEISYHIEHCQNSIFILTIP